MPGLAQPSLIHILEARKSRSTSVKNVLVLGTKRHGNPDILDSFGNKFKDAFVKAKQKDGKNSVEDFEESSETKTIVGQQKVQPVIKQVSQAPEGKGTSADNVPDVIRQNVNPEFSFVNIYRKFAETDVPQCNTTHHITDGENIVKVVQEKGKASPTAGSHTASPVTGESSGPSPRNGASPLSPRSSTSSVGTDDHSRQPESALNEVQETANGGDQASDRLSFLESEVAAYESLVTCKDNEVLGIQEDHQAEVEDLQERLASTEARLRDLETNLAKEIASKKKTIGQHNELKMQNKELKQQLGTEQTEAMNQLQAEIKGKDEELAAAHTKERMLVSDGGFWHGACLVAMSELEDANPDAAQRYNGIVRRKDEQIAELTEELHEAQENYRIEYAGRVDDRTKHFGTVAGLRKWETEVRQWCQIIAGTYEKLQGHVNQVMNTLNGHRSHDDAIESLVQACNGIKVENGKLSQASYNYDQQVIAQNETIAERDAKIIELEAALAHEQEQHALAKREPRQLERDLELQGIEHETVVQEYTVKVQELEKGLQKQVQARESLAQDVIKGTAAQIVVDGLNNQILGLQQDLRDSKAEVKTWANGYAYVHGELRELQGVGKYGNDLDVNISGVDFQDIADYQVELLRRRLKIAEAPLVADIGKRGDKVERKGGILAAWGMRYEVDVVDTE